MSDSPQFGALIGDGFVSKRPDGEIIGSGSYCGFPLVIRLLPDKRDGMGGYRVAMHIAPKDPPHA